MDFTHVAVEYQVQLQKFLFYMNPFTLQEQNYLIGFKFSGCDKKVHVWTFAY